MKRGLEEGERDASLSLFGIGRKEPYQLTNLNCQSWKDSKSTATSPKCRAFTSFREPKGVRIVTSHDSAIDLLHYTEANGEAIIILHCHQSIGLESRRRKTATSPQSICRRFIGEKYREY